MLIFRFGFSLLLILFLVSSNQHAASSNLDDIIHANVDFLQNFLRKEVEVNSTDALSKEWVEQVDSIIEKYLNKILSIQSVDQHIVQKRGIEEMTTITRDYQGVNVLSSIEELYDTNALFPSDITLFYSMSSKSSQELYAAYLESNKRYPEMSQANEMVVSKFENDGFKIFERVPVLGGVDIESFSIKDVPYIVSAEYDAGTSGKPLEGSVVYRIGSKNLERVQILNTKFPSDVSVWEDLNEVYMAVATDHIKKNGEISYEADSLIYRWLGEHFDLITTVRTYNAKCVTPFKIGSTMYLAVANHRNNHDETDIDSEIFQYKLNEDRFVSYQKIRTHAAMDIKFFSSGNKRKREHFIVVANLFELDIDGSKNYETGSIIYKYADDYFVPFQSITLDAAFQWLPVMGPRGELVLIAAYKSGIQIFQYDGWRFMKTEVQYSSNTLGPGISSLRTFTVGGGSVLAVANKRKYGDTADIFNLKFKPTSDLQSFHAELHTWCQNMHDKLDNDNIEELVEATQKAPKIYDDTIYVNGDMILENASIKKLENKQMQIGDISMDKELILDLNKISGSIDTIQYELENIEAAINNSMKVYGDNYIQGSIKFENFTVSCEKCEIQSGFIKTLNGESLDNFLKYAVNLMDGIVTSKSLEFESLSVESFQAEPRTINDHPTTALVGCSRDANFNGKVEVLGTTRLLGGLSVDGKVDGLTFSPETLLLAEGDQTLDGFIQLPWTHVDDLDLIRLNGMDVDSLFDGAVNVYGEHKIKNSATLSKVYANEVKINGLIYGFDLESLVNSTLKVCGDQTLYGNWTFEKLYCDSFTTDGLISGKILKRDLVYINGFQYKIDGDLEFTQPLHVDQLYVDKNFNGISVRDGELDLFLLKPRETMYVQGTKVFESAHVSSHLKIGSTFNGKNISEWDSYRVIEGETMIYGDVVIGGNLFVNGSIKVNDMRNEDSKYSLAKIIKHGVKLESPTFPGSSVTFIGTIEVEKLQVENINGIKPESWVNKNADEVQVVSAWKTFEDGILIVDSVNVTDSINGVNLVELDKDILKTYGDQIIEGTKFFNRIGAPRITTDDCLFGDYKCEDLMLAKEVQDITGVNAFKNSVLVKNLSVKNLEVKGSVAGYDINFIIKDTLFPDGDVWEVKAPKEFKGKLKFDNVKVKGSTGNLNMDGIISMLYAKQHTVANASTFTNHPTKIENFYFTGWLDGIHHEEFGNSWLLKDGPQIINGKQTFTKVKSNANIVLTSGEINGWNLGQLMENAVMINEDLTLDHITFVDVISVEPVILEGKLNDLNISTDLVLEEDGEFKRIISEKILESDLIIDGNLIVEDLDYEINFEKMCELFLEYKKPDLKVLVEGGVEMEIEPIIKGINGNDVENLFSNCWMKDKDVEIPGYMAFNVMNFQSDVEVKNVDGIDIKWLSENYLSKTKDQTIQGIVSFLGGVIFEKSVTSPKAYVSGDVCGLQLENLESKVLLDGPEQFIYGSQKFKEVIIKGDLDVNGTINGNTLDNMLRWDKDLNVINGNMVIKSIYTKELELGSNSKVQGVDISLWNKLAVMSQNPKDSYIIKGTKSFENAKFQNGLFVEGEVDHLRFDKENLLLLSEEQIVTGKKIFNHGEDGYALTVNQLEVEGRLNDIDVSDFLGKLAYKNEDTTFTDQKEFTSPIFADHVTIDGLYHGINLSQIDMDKVKLAYEERWFSYFPKLDSVSKDFQESLQRRAVYVSHYRSLHKFEKDVRLALPISREERLKPDFAAVRFGKDNQAVITTYELHPENDCLVIGNISTSAMNVVYIASLMCNTAQVLYIETLRDNEPDNSYVNDYDVPDKQKDKETVGYFLNYFWDGFQEYYRIKTSKTSTIVSIMLPVHDGCCYFLAQWHGNISPILCQTETPEIWKVFQEIPTYKVIEASVGSINDSPCIVILNENYKQQGADELNIEILKFSNTENIFISWQKISLEGATSISSIEYRGFSLLAVASGYISRTINSGYVKIYRTNPDDGLFTEWVDLDVILPWSVKFSILPSNELVLYVSTESSVKPFVVFLYKGVSGFKEFTHSFDVPSKSQIDIFTRGTKNSFVTVSGNGRNQILMPVFKGA